MNTEEFPSHPRPWAFAFELVQPSRSCHPWEREVALQEFSCSELEDLPSDSLSASVGFSLAGQAGFCSWKWYLGEICNSNNHNTFMCA